MSSATVNNNSTIRKYTSKPWYIHPILIGILFALWPLFGIPLILGVILLIISAQDSKKKAAYMRSLHLDKVIDLDVIEKSIAEKTLHDKSLTILANVKDQYKTTNAEYTKVNAALKERIAHNVAISTLESTLKEEEKIRAKALSSVRKELDSYSEKIEKSKQLYAKIAEKVKSLKEALIPLEEEVDLQNVGFYGIDFDTNTSAQYKTEMIKLQDEQKKMVKNKTACDASTGMTYNGSLAQGKKMVNQQVKMTLWSFNTHCDTVISKVSYRNKDISERKIRKAFDVINSNSDIASVSYQYLELKLKELEATFKFKELLEHEKELLREQREQEREEKKLQQEIARERAKLEKDETHISTELARLQRLLTQEQSDKMALQKEIGSLEGKLMNIGKKKSEIDFREAHAKAGYVYVISNIGSFGKDVVKIGVTRRLEPIERVNELGDASVPFRFDVHALMFSDQAYKLEKALHDRFASRRLNQVNNRKEFFRVPLEQVRDAMIKEFNGTSVEFHMQPDAKEFRQSIAKLREAEAASVRNASA